MTRGEVPRLVVKAILVSLLIQVPFIILITLGVHSVAGGIGYAFYYPWILDLESLDRIVGGNWENNWPLLQTVLCILQTIPLSAVAFLLMAFKQGPGSKGRSVGGHA
jgi:hypothetical protein